MARLLPHRNGRRWEIRVGKVANGNGDVSGETVILPENGRAACRAKMKGHRVAAFGRPRPGRSLAGKGDLLQAKARLVADHGPSAALALQAVTQGDARWFALNRDVKLPAAAGGTTGH